jgi:iron complex transport system substrate-binding protein
MPGPESSGGPPAVQTLIDGLGRKITVPVPARRIVSLAPSNTEILFAIGAGTAVAGRDDFSDYPPEAAKVPAVGLATGRLQKEKIIALDPDLVLAAEINSPEQVKALETLGLTVLLLGNPTSFEGLDANIRLLGEITGRSAEGAALASSLNARIARVRERIAGVARRPTVFYEIDSTDPTKPWTAGAGTFIDTLIRLAGGENLGARFGGDFPRVSIETIIRADPDVIILGDAAFGVTVETARGRAGWEGLSAVQNGRIHAFDDDLGSRPGPRLVEGLETLARLLHPDLGR